MKIALVTNLSTHYRRPLFDELGRRAELDVYLTSRGTEWYWPRDSETQNSNGAIVEPSAVGLARQLSAGDHDRIIPTLTGRAPLLAAFLSARLQRFPLVP